MFSEKKLEECGLGIIGKPEISSYFLANYWNILLLRDPQARTGMKTVIELVVI